MSQEDDLFEELVRLRDGLRTDRKAANGRTSAICSDEALREMAQRVPTKAEDFSAIVGVGQRFVEQYGDDFLAVTRRYAVSAARGSEIGSDAARTLRELEKKLINISRANRLLFQARISKKNAFDLSLIPESDVMGLMFGRKRSLKLCDQSKGPEQKKLYKHLNEIVRAVNREMRERGQYDLYIGYPFVQGRLPDGDFDVRAPLALFPVVLEKDARTMTLSMDSNRDAMYNNTLVLAFTRAMGTNRPLPNNIIEDAGSEGFMDSLIEFYHSNGIDVGYCSGPAAEFKGYRSGEFPKYNAGSMQTVPNIVLGKYPMYSSSIQRDFDGMLAKNEINGILNDLVADLDGADLMSDLPEPLTEEELKAKGMEASEKDLAYINSLNSAQESILTAIEKGDEIVVEGPPGTGKSQVITGLIASAVLKGRTVLMVSEKKTALDVVYSRLGDLSKYCLLIDDVGNKGLFYRQLSGMLRSTPPRGVTDIDEVSERVDRDVAMLQSIADAVYSPCEFGVDPCTMYALGRHADAGDRETLETYSKVMEGLDESLKSLDYKSLSGLHKKFSADSTMRSFKEYRSLRSEHPWMAQMRGDLTEFDLARMKADLEDLERQMIEWRGKGFVGRLFSKGKVERETTSMIDRYFTGYSERTIREIKDDPRRVAEALEDYDRFSERTAAYEAMTVEERSYGNDIVSLSDQLRKPLKDMNDEVFGLVMEEHTQRFDATHKDILQRMQEFDTYIADMEEGISAKRELCRARAEEVLKEDLKYITESKRCGDIARIAESKRKWSLNRFIDRYGYELFKGVRVWLLTPEVVSEILPLQMGIFDLLIFDEASQMYVEKGIPSMFRAKKVVVAGDHKQLRPSSLGTGRVEWDGEDDDDEEVSAALEEESLLDLARARYDSILLNFHYRSRYEELIAFSNHAFYNGRLYVSPNVSRPRRPPIEYLRIDGEWKDKSNKKEADRVVALLKEVLTTRTENESIGIITFNVSQRDLINDVLDEECAKDSAFGKTVAEETVRSDNGEDTGLFIKNIEGVQGDERDVIIFSVGYARNDEGKLMQRFGWLNNRGGENRLNVAVSRARRKVYVVSSIDPEDLQVDESKNDGPRILKKYLQYARAVSDGDRDAADALLRSFSDGRREDPSKAVSDRTADQVYSMLVRKGYTVERDVGIGGYTIDLAIRQNDRYILGIECDSRLYAMPVSTRERDYHRQKYLESRGWTMHRVWTPGMWKNPEREVARIVESIEKACEQGPTRE